MMRADVGLKSDKKTGLAERCGTMSNFRGEATNFRGAMSNFRGEATNFRGAMSNFRGAMSNFRGAMSNFRGEATGGNQWPLHKWIYYINEVKTHILVTHRRSQETKMVVSIYVRVKMVKSVCQKTISHQKVWSIQ